MPAPRRSLRGELLFSFAFLASAAVLLVGASAILLARQDPGTTAWALLFLWLGSTAVVVVFGAWLVRQRILRPLRLLADQADALAAGQEPPAVTFDTTDFAALGERFRVMAARLLDAQGQVVRAEKLAAVGRLAAGVAHEIRNPLGALGNYVEVLRRRGGDAELTGAMHREIERMDRIVEGLLDYARPRGRAPAPADAARVIRATTAFLTDQGALQGHALALDVADGLAPVGLEAHALEQVLVNLVLNARDARADGRIWVGAQAAAAGLTFPRRAGDPDGVDVVSRRVREVRPRRPDLPLERSGVLIYVADEGPGVPDAERERIFDPFYTTKPPGEGTGLGLAIVARTVHDAGGLVWVDRGREGGAVFRVFLPSATEAA
jgi:signal transduction histidine kinase